MIASFIITFRETLEAALIIGIILSFLARTKQSKYNNVVYIGIVFGLIASIIGALLFINLAGGFEGRAEQIFEGIVMLIGALLLTTMILWMMKQRHVTVELEHKVEKNIIESNRFGLFLLVFISILREGIETIIFLGAASVASAGNSLIGGFGGIVTAMFLGYIIFVGSKKINIKKFFSITSILLILFAAGLVAHGIHELGEAKIIPSIINEIWNINPPAPLADKGIYPLLHENGYIGSVLRGLFGYNGNPSLIELIAYLVYLILAFVLWKNIKKIHKLI
ncbi:high-affinity iron transporter [Candidatus Pacearchaeota archaeon CG10_big_fil_rev_8_21_14_0_10_32_42]|nr:MAG: high-affinity iron transporter [Candidatus Pacearchaeota archaeon CG10_big_fil_rev_8_21_14_0_10_32_42]